MMLLPFSLVCFYANNTVEVIFFEGGVILIAQQEA